MTTPIHSTDSAPRSVDDRLKPMLSFAFARLHKFALGVAAGTAAAMVMAAITAIALLSPTARAFPLELFAQYFSGYSVSWAGVLVGAVWGFVVGFVGGWFLAFCRNFSLAAIAFTMRARAELASTRDFLDHI